MTVTSALIKQLPAGTSLRISAERSYVVGIVDDDSNEVTLDFGRGPIRHTFYYRSSLPVGEYLRGNSSTSEALRVGLVPVFLTHQGWARYLGCIESIELL